MVIQSLKEREVNRWCKNSVLIGFKCAPIPFWVVIVLEPYLYLHMALFYISAIIKMPSTLFPHVLASMIANRLVLGLVLLLEELPAVYNVSSLLLLPDFLSRAS